MEISNFGTTTKNFPTKRPAFIFLYSLMFLLALIVTTGLINLISPPFQSLQGTGDVGVKFQYFTEHKDDYDIIFLGPSTTYHGIIPKLFDELMTANGYQVKSFNLGIPGANVAEMDFYLQKVLALKPTKLKWIFLDCIFDVFNEEEEPAAIKNVYWHTPEKTIENFRLIFESNRSLLVKIKAFYTNFISFLYHWFGIGDFSNFLQQRKEVLSNGISGEKLLQEAGYYAIDWMDNGEKRKRLFLSNYGEAYQQRLVKAKVVLFEQDDTYNAYKYPLTKYGIKIFKDFVAKVDELEKVTKIKVEPIFLIPPTLHPEIAHSASAIIKAFELGYIPTLFDFNHPNTLPNLYEMSNRIDDLHLNHQGAEKLTHILAIKFSEYLKLFEKEVANQSFGSKN